MNLGGAQTTTGVASVLENADDDAVDPHLERIKNAAGEEDSDEEVLYAGSCFYYLFFIYFAPSIHHITSLQDEDFVADKDDGGSPSDDSDEEESDASESGNDKVISFLFSLNAFVTIGGVLFLFFFDVRREMPVLDITCMCSSTSMDYFHHIL